jgi:hypothetical protein
MRPLKIAAACCTAAAIVTLAWAAFQSTAAPVAPAKPLAPYFPSGALLYLEARDFAAVMKQWNDSPEKREWLASDNHAEFSRSHLLLRLAEAQNEFAAATGVPPKMPFLQQVAGRESALALYDIGKLQFLYVTRMPMSSVAASALWQARGKYETRSVAGTTYFVHSTGKGTLVAFAATNDYLVLATREDLIAGALSLIAVQGQRKLADEPWYDRSVKAAHEPGDLRMVLDLEKIIATPYFRSYWVQRNVSDLKQYSACISDLRLSKPEFIEERILVRKDAPAVQQRSNLGDVLRLVPDDAGFYRAWSDPSGALTGSLLDELTWPLPGRGPGSDYAPGAPGESANAGSETDLERRIDQPPVTIVDTKRRSLHSWLGSARISAVLQVEGTSASPDGVFFTHAKALIFASPQDWNAEGFRSVLQEDLAPHWSTSQLGMRWVQSGNVFRLDGLAKFTMAVSTRYLIVADDARLVEAVLARLNAPAPQVQATYAAGFAHLREQQPFVRTTSIVDRSRTESSSRPGFVAAGHNAGDDERRPPFFSGNVASLSKVLRRVRSETLLSNDAGEQVTQIVRYRWSD